MEKVGLYFSFKLQLRFSSTDLIHNALVQWPCAPNQMILIYTLIFHKHPLSTTSFSNMKHLAQLNLLSRRDTFSYQVPSVPVSFTLFLHPSLSFPINNEMRYRLYITWSLKTSPRSSTAMAAHTHLHTAAIFLPRFRLTCRLLKYVNWSLGHTFRFHVLS